MTGGRTEARLTLRTVPFATWTTRRHHRPAQVAEMRHQNEDVRTRRNFQGVVPWSIIAIVIVVAFVLAASGTDVKDVLEWLE